MICAGCLGSRSDDFNEIVECDGCGVTVHEGNRNYKVFLYAYENAKHIFLFHTIKYFYALFVCMKCTISFVGCYGVSDVTSESSTVSSASTEPWFCEACKAGVTDPNCELCPNKGIISILVQMFFCYFNHWFIALEVSCH